MDEITLTYRAWKRIDPRYRSIFGGAPVALVYDDGVLVLVRVRFERSERSAPVARCPGQLELVPRRSAA
jgi:hypothetical protein